MFEGDGEQPPDAEASPLHRLTLMEPLVMHGCRLCSKVRRQFLWADGHLVCLRCVEEMAMQAIRALAAS